MREHADGRRLVYGALRAGDGGVYAGWRGAAGGFLIPTGDDAETVRSIRRMGEIVGDAALADECIGDLPALDLGGANRATSTATLATLLALLVQAQAHVPSELAAEIRANLAG